MSADDVAVLVAAGAASVAAVGSLATAVVLGHRVRDLRRLVEDLRRETVPLVHQARRGGGGGGHRDGAGGRRPRVGRGGDGHGGLGLTLRLPGLRQPRGQGARLRHRDGGGPASTGGTIGPGDRDERSAPGPARAPRRRGPGRCHTGDAPSSSAEPGPAVTRRLMWMGVGAAAGSGATMWLRRRVDRLARTTPGQVAGGVVSLVDHRARTTAGRVRQSVETGRSAARHRELELRHDLEGRDPTR